MKRYILLTGFLMLILSFTSNIYAQTSTILNGHVIDKETKEALPFVNIVEIDKNGRYVSGVTTDLNGNFTIKIKDTNNSLQISYIGYKKTSMSIDKQTTIKVELESESLSIESINVIADVVGNDGVTKVRDRGTAVARMEFKDMESVASTTVEEMMQGRLGNVDITAVSGDPGAGINIRIRGTSTLNANNNPLIVINGIPYDANIDADFNFAAADVEQFGSLIDVAPGDIESIEVLKDAASTAIWGSKASNGVLMIKTKRGIKSKPVFDYTFKSTFGVEPDAIPMLDGAGYARLITEEHFNDIRGEYSSPEIAFDPEWIEYWNYAQSTDWVKEITKTSYTQQHEFSVRGGGDKSRYNLSFGYTDEGGTTIGTGLTKINLRSSLDYDLSTKLKFKTDIMYTRYDRDQNYNDDNSNHNDDPRAVAYRKMPNLSVYERDTNNVHFGEFFTPTSTIQGTSSSSGMYNPVAFATLGVNNEIKDNARALFNIRYLIHPTFIFNSTVTLDIFDSKRTKFLPTKAVGDFFSNSASDAFSKKSSIYTINQLIYTPDFGEDHNFVAMTQFDTEETVNRSFRTSASGSGSAFLQDPYGERNLGSFYSGFSEYKSMGAYAMSQYIYKDKYIFMIGAKAEGNSKFSKDSRWGIFPTASLAYRISEEPFMKWIKFIDDFKLRGSWGQSGNTPKDNYLYFNTYNAGTQYAYLNEQGVVPAGIELTSLKWETIEQTNLGFSFFALNNRLNIEFDVYRKSTLDLYLKNSGLAQSTGFGSFNQNNGEMENRGIEFMMDYSIVKKKDFEISMNFNISSNVNIVRRLPANYSLEYGDMLENGNYKISIQPGQAMGGFYGYKYLGVYERDEDAIVTDKNGQAVLGTDGVTPLTMIHGAENYQYMGGDAKYNDRNYDGQINELDIEYLGDLNPDYMGGAGARMKYKNLVLNTFFHYKVGQNIINQTRIDTEKMYGHDNQSKATDWRWRRQGDITNVPRALFGKGFNYLGSDRFVEDGSFIRLKTLSLSFIFKKETCKKLNVKGLKVYSTAYNLFTWTNYSGQDPDVSQPSNPSKLPKDSSKTPPSRKLMFGVNVTF